MIANIGLSIITLAWTIQLLSKNNKLNPNFVLIYLLGVALLIADGFAAHLYTLMFLNIFSFITALLVYTKFNKKTKKS